MEHFEDDFELQRCGGCGRRFERKAALTSHSQICQKRIAACSRIQKEPDSPSKLLPVSIPPTKPAMPKIQMEKKIGIQVRMNYCKTGSLSTTHSEERRSTRFGLGDESDVEGTSVDGKYAPSSHSSMKDPTEVRTNSGFDHFLQVHRSMESSGSIDKVKVYLSNALPNRKKEDIGIQNNVISNYFPKLGKLEAKCLQLRKALEVDTSSLILEEVTEKPNCSSSQIEETEVGNKTEDNTSKDVTSVLCDDTVTDFDCKNESMTVDGVPEEIQLVKDVPIKSDLPEQIPLPEADSTSVCSSSESVEIIYEENRSINETETVIASNDSSNGPANNTIEESEKVSTSLMPVEDIPIIKNEIIQINDETNDESGSSKENLESCMSDVKNQNDSVIRGCENEFLLENTISILTRNQLRAICKDDVVKVDNRTKEPHTTNTSTNHTLKSKIEENNRASSGVQNMLLKYIRVRKLQCLICMKRYKSLKNLRVHVAEHTGCKIFRCLGSDCTFSSYSRTDCVTHVFKKHLKPNEKDLVSSLIGEISPSEWKFNFNKTYPVAVKSSANNRNSARLKTKNMHTNGVQNTTNKIKVIEKTGVNKISRETPKPTNENMICEQASKRRRMKEDNDKIVSDGCGSIKGTKRSSVLSSAVQTVESTIIVNMVPNSNPGKL